MSKINKPRRRICCFREFDRIVSSRSRISMVLLLIIITGLVFIQGCSSPKSVGQYFKYRYEDFCDMVDIGFTFSAKPGFALYANGVGVSPGGLAYIDGYFLGIGGGQIGPKRYFFKSAGVLVWGHETVGWGDFDKNNPDTLNKQGAGVLGIVIGPNGMLGHVGLMGPGQGPDYLFACVHNLHLGFIGVVANARYTQAPDFVLGIIGLDPALDDGYEYGRFPWQRRRWQNMPPPNSRMTPDSMLQPTLPESEPALYMPPSQPAPVYRPPAQPATISPAYVAGRTEPPQTTNPAADTSAWNTYVVKPGDTFYGIARQVYGNPSLWPRLYEANRARLGLTSPESLKAGSVLQIPPAE